MIVTYSMIPHMKHCTKYIKNWYVVLIPLVLFGCGTNFEYNVTSELNPSKISPLTAMLNITANAPCTGIATVLGEFPVEYEFDLSGTELEVPIIGLYPGIENQILLNLDHEGGSVVDTILITTEALPDFIPSVEINKMDRSRMEPGMHLCDLHYAKHGTYDSRPMIFDDQGKVRWFLDLSFFGDIIWPIQRLKNRSLLVAGKNEIYEFDMLGRVVKNYTLDPKYRIHHDIVELPDGKLLLAVRTDDVFIQYEGEQIPSWNDIVILFDPETEQIEREWDFAKHMDVSRSEMNYTVQTDWLHMNGLAFDPKDSSIVMSGKNQGVAKVSWNDELQWILAPKKYWGKAGRNGEGPETSSYLLTAVDADGTPYDEEVQNGSVSHEDFDFPWGQHAPEILENGNIILYDNGYKRHFDHEVLYSRGVEFHINVEDMTVQQIWQYGKERKREFYSMLISDVDYLPETENILITAGFIYHNSKIVEVEPNTGEEVFEATLTLKTLNGDKTFNWGQLDLLYRSERFVLEY